MPLVPHCDRCGNVIDGFASWVEDIAKRPSSDIKPIWHIHVHAGGRLPVEDRMFCRACMMSILQQYLSVLLQGVGQPGGMRQEGQSGRDIMPSL